MYTSRNLPMADIVREINFVHLAATIDIFYKTTKWIAVREETACFVRISQWLFRILLK
jgi:hypothetical protein